MKLQICQYNYQTNRQKSHKLKIQLFIEIQSNIIILSVFNKLKCSFMSAYVEIIVSYLYRQLESCSCKFYREKECKSTGKAYFSSSHQQSDNQFANSKILAYT